MNKFLYIFLLIFLISSSANSKDIEGTVQDFGQKSEVAAPEFCEFAPVGYLNRKPNSEILTASEEGIANLINRTFIGIPIGNAFLKHAELRKKNNLWADRKQNFEASIKYCQASQTEKELKDCYKKIKRVELYKNADIKKIQLKGNF